MQACKRPTSAFNHFGLRAHSIQRKVKPIMGSVFFISSIVLDEEISCRAQIDFHDESNTHTLTAQCPLHFCHSHTYTQTLKTHKIHKHVSIQLLGSESDRFSLALWKYVFCLPISKHTILLGMFCCSNDNRLPSVCSRVATLEAKRNETSIKN